MVYLFFFFVVHRESISSKIFIIDAVHDIYNASSSNSGPSKRNGDENGMERVSLLLNRNPWLIPEGLLSESIRDCHYIHHGSGFTAAASICSPNELVSIGCPVRQICSVRIKLTVTRWFLLRDILPILTIATLCFFFCFFFFRVSVLDGIQYWPFIV